MSFTLVLYIYLGIGAVYVGWEIRCDKAGRAYVAQNFSPFVILGAVLLFIWIWPFAAILNTIDRFKGD